jgi:spore germination protein
MFSSFSKIVAFACVFTLIGSPLFAQAKEADLQVSGWIPYWRDSEGIKDAKKHLASIDMVYPFAYTVTKAGEVRDQAGLTDKEWKSFMALAKKKNVEVVPTVMWSDGATIHAVLSATTSRTAHINSIVSMVEKGKFDGVDIDYEAKKSETINFYSQFLKELKAKLGKKLLTCTVEARTPPESLYKEVPAVINYANDYTEIAKYCDQVEIMAYDQQRADIKLNDERSGKPYMPLADAAWVEKVIQQTLKDIPKEKIVLGIATYGHHYAVTVAPNWYRDYWKLGAMNVPSLKDIAKEEKVTPTRNAAGELSFSYLPKGSSHVNLTSSLKIPKNTPKGDIVAAKALAYANKTGKEVVFNIGWYSDAEAMKQKIDLAKKYNLRGVALFKIDGEEDQKVWNYLK